MCNPVKDPDAAGAGDAARGRAVVWLGVRDARPTPPGTVDRPEGCAPAGAVTAAGAGSTLVGAGWAPEMEPIGALWTAASTQAPTTATLRKPIEIRTLAISMVASSGLT
jgi:hypothetical protein